eukprot:CAMPEP_0201644264 /NCGR_PEP_ID=MMETSP0493-20130528/29851_1 /ASSEMBLY_ACC=CAM_ASM_000838 /TAXON_ID=420259 /ORGANISM="Thalassiosira gravida, Strain GMp14c1" /LENGTH=415 /DNA_ID=CAMNT_0048118923 /DNA_START=72 /DNA_END=1319 /DNA_ORIENTATION=+
MCKFYWGMILTIALIAAFNLFFIRLPDDNNSQPVEDIQYLKSSASKKTSSNVKTIRIGKNKSTTIETRPDRNIHKYLTGIMSDDKPSSIEKTTRISESTLVKTRPDRDIYKYLSGLMSEVQLHGPKGRLIDLGAGVRDDDPCFPFVDAGWDGLLVDGDPSQTTKWASRFPQKDAKHNIVSYITSDTVGDIIAGNGFGSNNVDLLKIDIDSFDCYVMHKVLQITRPLFIVMEVNVKYPPNIRFAMFPGFQTDDGSQLPFDSEKRGHVYGCSLAYQVLDLMRPNDYEILHLDWNNAIYYDKRAAAAAAVNGDGSFEFSPPSFKDLYVSNYWSRPERRSAFAFNNAIELWVMPGLGKQGIFTEIRKLYRSDSSHKNHHVFMGGVEDEELEHMCFDASGRFVKAGESPEKCSAMKGVNE